MKTKKGIFYCVALFLAGCLPSLHPLYNDKTLIFKEELIGKWMGDDDVLWRFTRAGDKEYELRIREDEKEDGRFSAHLIEIKGLMFLDLYPDDEQLKDLSDFYKIHILPVHTFMKVDQISPNLQLRMVDSDFYKIHILPVHTFMKVDQISPNLQLRMVDYDKVKKMIENDPNVIKHEVVEDDRIVVTASTEELQNFVLKHVETIFTDKDNSSNAVRLKPLYSEKDIVVDPNLIGKWKTEDGGILSSSKTVDKTYELTYFDSDDTKQKVFANLVQHHDELLMAVFADKAELNPNEPNAYALHLIPDWVFRVRRTKSELVLQQLDYKEVSESLQKNKPLPELQPENASYSFRGTRIEP